MLKVTCIALGSEAVGGRAITGTWARRWINVHTDVKGRAQLTCPQMWLSTQNHREAHKKRYQNGTCETEWARGRAGGRAEHFPRHLVILCSAQPHDTKAWLDEDLGTSIHVQITQKLNGETHCSPPMKMDELLILAALWMKFCTIMLVEKGLVEGLLYSTWSHFYTEFYKWRLMSDDWSGRCGKARLGKEGCIYEMSLENFIQLSWLPWLRLLHSWKH